MKIDGGSSALAEDAKFIKTLYHGTTENRVKSIMKHGIRPQKQNEEKEIKGHHVHISTDPGFASMMANSRSELSEKPTKPVLLHIDRNHPSVRNFKRDPDAFGEKRHNSSFITKNTIHSSAIKKIENVPYEEWR